MNFTKEQEQAVRLRDCDILVSAGAGAGKTRVLVSRMAEMILDEEHPLSVNDFLVMTFTNAAAEEMRERITAELDLRLEKEPQNRRLRRQVRLMKHADISTVHSFCNRLIRTHFNEAGIDPSFRIGEEGELFLLRQKAMEDVLEEAYESGRESFRRFVEAYAPGKNDRMIENLIEEMYRFSRGFPDRDQWLIAVRKEERLLESPETVTKSRAFLTLSARVRGVLEALLAEVEAGLELFCGAPESERFDALLAEDAEKIQALLEEEDFDALCEAFAGLKLANLPRANKKEKEWPYLEEAQSLHKTVREELQQIRQDYFLYDLQELCRENRELSGCFEELITLSGRYEELYFQSKKDRNVYDFDDLEHIALSLLVESYGEDGRPTPSAVAEELSEKYKAVFVDEYQDTNLVQETILNTICREGKNHLFVVGDVKQSIYRFRQARPDLFLSRYDRYHKTEEAAADGLLTESQENPAAGQPTESQENPAAGQPAERQENPAAGQPAESQENPVAGQPAGVRVELRDNFRSVPGVLGLCNLVFSRLMDRQFGGVDYTEDIALRPGKGGPMEQEKEESEMLLLIEDAEKDNLAMEIHSVEAETAMIARRIRGLLEEGYGYGDMVILLRSDAGRAEVMAEFLTAAGIPAVCESRTGYFQTREVQLVLNYLAIVDNVYQDIPMASVLLSSIGGLTEEELARLRVLTSAPTRQEYAFFDLIEIYLAEGKDEGLREKLDRFVEQLLYFRKKKKEMPLHALLWEIYTKTGIFYQVQMLPEGETRKENLLMLLKKAEDYEKTVFKGLFYFLRYMEQLRTYEVEPVNGALKEEGGDQVRIMTIHKSKGLEFPVVFVSGLSRRFNLMDTNRPALFSPELGVGLEYVDLTARMHHASLLKKAIREQMKRETLEEELRILYVAMTRAQRKLILTGMTKETAIETAGGWKLTLERKLAARSFMDWLLPLLPELPVRKVHFHELEEEFKPRQETKTALSLEEYMQQDEMQADTSPVEKTFSFVYPHREAFAWKRKYAVSELKSLSMTPVDGEEEFMELPPARPGGHVGEAGNSRIAETVDAEADKGAAKTVGAETDKGAAGGRTDEEIPRPQFLKEAEPEAVGAARGTIIHKIMEQLPFGKIHTKKDLFDALQQIEKEYPACEKISMKRVYRGVEAFLFSDIGEKVRRMDREGTLRKELPFTVGLPAGDGDRIVVQGVIDACGEAEDGLWLIDYKTDWISEGEEGLLLDRYKMQMVYYKTALEQILSKKVTHSYIFSFALGRYLELFREEEL